MLVAQYKELKGDVPGSARWESTPGQGARVRDRKVDDAVEVSLFAWRGRLGVRMPAAVFVEEPEEDDDTAFASTSAYKIALRYAYAR